MLEKEARSKLCPLMPRPGRETCQGSRCMLWTYEGPTYDGRPFDGEEIRGHCGAFMVNVTG